MDTHNFNKEFLKLGSYELDISGFTIHKKTPPFRSFADRKHCNIDITSFNISTNEDSEINEGILKIFKADYLEGQDVRGIATIPQNGKTPEQALLFVCDGHGSIEEGQIIANNVIKIICRDFCKKTFQIIKYLDRKLTANVKKRIREIINKIFKEANEEICRNSNKNAGTTCTIKWFLNIDGLTSIDIVLGDSPTMSVKNGEIVENCFQQNCENKEAILQWLNLNFKDNSENVPDVVLGRFNTSLISPRADWVKGKVKLYNQVFKDGKWHLENSEVLKQFYENMPKDKKELISKNGGVQTLRDKKKFKKLLSQNKYPAFNYGNTVNGRGQNLGEFGGIDVIKKLYNHCVPNVKITKNIGKDMFHILASDGLIDTLMDEDILDACNQIYDATDILKDILDKSYSNALSSKWRFKDNLGTWDDHSAWFIKINKSKDIRLDEYLDFLR